MPAGHAISILGIDGFYLLRVHLLAFKLFVFSSILCCIVLIPVNIMGGGDGEGLEQLTMGNLTDSSGFAWFHLFCLYAVIGFACWLIFNEWKLYVKVRRSFYLSQTTDWSLRTVLVRDIPRRLRDNDEFLAFSKRIYGPTVLEAFVARDSKRLEKEISKRDSAFHKLERKIYDYRESGQEKRPTHRLHFVGKSVDSIDYFQGEVEKHEKKISSMIHGKGDLKLCSSGFIVFSSFRTRYEALQMIAMSRRHRFLVYPAPEPSDVEWKNLNIPLHDREVRSMMIDAFIATMIVFYMIPITFISSLTSLSSLTELLPFLTFILDVSPALQGFLEGYLPTLALTIFMAILPPLLHYLNTLRGVESGSVVRTRVFRNYFNFQFVNFFLGSVITGSFFTFVQDVVDNPTSLPSLLAESFPSYSSFFIEFVMLQAFTVLILQAIRYIGLILGYIKLGFAKTDHEVENVKDTGFFSYHVNYANQMLVFVIGVTFCVISPLILPFCACYFGIGMFVNSYELVFVYRPFPEAGGILFPHISNRMFLSLFVLEILMVGYFSLRVNIAQAILTLPLIAFTSYIYYDVDVFQHMANALSLEEIHELEQEEQEDVNLAELYRQDSLYTKPLELEPLEPSYEEI